MAVRLLDVLDIEPKCRFETLFLDTSILRQPNLFLARKAMIYIRVHVTYLFIPKNLYGK